MTYHAHCTMDSQDACQPGTLLTPPTSRAKLTLQSQRCSVRTPRKMTVTVIGKVMRPSISSTASYLFQKSAEMLCSHPYLIQKSGKSFNCSDSLPSPGPVAMNLKLIPIRLLPCPLSSGIPSIPRSRHHTALTWGTSPQSLSSTKSSGGRERR